MYSTYNPLFIECSHIGSTNHSAHIVLHVTLEQSLSRLSAKERFRKVFIERCI